ncbi:thioredoxin-like 4, chloroplastic [Rutidosis leptorrhynchoides]|uniref:thioredoxin-like 4, chloroplastic n=1 Tax=Rutidosis leptorrhynchoides TaxID=125765 RepID=UPI003A993300
MSWSIHASIHKQGTVTNQIFSSFANSMNLRSEFKNSSTLDTSSLTTCHLKDKAIFDDMKWQRIHCPLVHCTGNEDPQELSDEDEELCPVECVREIKKDEELIAVIEKAKNSNTLVVVDFYRTSCGSCKYIEQGFAKLCKGAGDEEASVIFLKHNVIDEYDEQSDIAERLRIKSVPLFHFYKNGMLLEAFATRDKVRIKSTIEKYTMPFTTAAQNA